MIYTITLSPSLDYYQKVENFTINKIQRSKSTYITTGGKGLNVSIMLSTLGIVSTTLGFTGGFVGRQINDSIKDKKIINSFTNIADNSRINTIILSEHETIVNAEGPRINEDEVNKFFESLNTIKDNDVVVISGSIPKELNDTFYEKILYKLENKNIKIVVDSTKNNLLNTLKFKPFLIKPNIHELSEIIGKDLKTKEETIDALLKLQSMGVKNIIVSLGKNGALMLTENKDIIYQPAYKGKVISTIGAGDSLIAGFLKSYLEINDYKKALAFGCLAGSATSFSDTLATIEDIKHLEESNNF